MELTREEAAKKLKGIKESLNDYCSLNEEGEQVFDMAIKALSQPEPCEDAVSRRATISACELAANRRQAIEYIRGLPPVTPKAEPCEDAVSRSWLLAEYDRQHQGPPGGARKIIETAPSVTPAQKEGEWRRKKDNWWKCSKCGNTIYSESETVRYNFHAYCGRCGARMKPYKGEGVTHDNARSKRLLRRYS